MKILRLLFKRNQDNPTFKTIIYSVFMNNCLLVIKQILLKNDIKFVDIDGAVETKWRQTNLNQYNDHRAAYMFY